jgi:hypothetical protein
MPQLAEQRLRILQKACSFVDSNNVPPAAADTMRKAGVLEG